MTAPSASAYHLKLGYGSWLSASLNVEVIKIIVEEMMGYTVEFVPCDEPTGFVYIKNAKIDAFIELWDSASPPEVDELKDASIGYCKEEEEEEEEEDK